MKKIFSKLITIIFTYFYQVDILAEENNSFEAKYEIPKELTLLADQSNETNEPLKFVPYTTSEDRITESFMIK